MRQMLDIACDQLNNWRWDNPRDFGDQIVRSNPQMTSSGNIERTNERSSWDASHDLSAMIEPPGGQQYKPGDFLAIEPLK